MSIPSGHQLGTPRRVLSARGSHFEATCGCGITLRHVQLWRVWEAHGDHLRHVKWLAMRSHPSRRGEA